MASSDSFSSRPIRMQDHVRMVSAFFPRVVVFLKKGTTAVSEVDRTSNARVPEGE